MPINLKNVWVISAIKDIGCKSHRETVQHVFAVWMREPSEDEQADLLRGFLGDHSHGHVYIENEREWDLEVKETPLFE